jgi:acetyl-CoA acyltransferase 2
LTGADGSAGERIDVAIRDPPGSLGMKDIVIIDGARTAFGTYGGALRDTSATDLGVIAAKAALERSRVPPERIDHVIFGNVLQTSGDAVYFARHIGLKSGVPKEVPALTVNRLCGSGLQAILLGAQEIQLGQAEFVLAGGAENMSMAPHQIRARRLVQRPGHGQHRREPWPQVRHHP